LILLLFGPPGCGKGTQSRRLSEWLEIPAISTGDMLRAELAAGSELGRKVAHVVKSGGLVGDELVNRILLARIRQEDCAGGFLLDGYPRTVPQAAFLDDVLARDTVLAQRRLGHPHVLYFDVEEQVLTDRISARRQCPQCGRIYNIALQPPRVAGRCDDDGAELLLRADDRPDVVKERLHAYAEFTAPVLDYYTGGELHRVNAMQAPDKVFQDILDVLGAPRVEAPNAVRRNAR